MPRLILWHCDTCGKESRVQSAGWLVLKQFTEDRPKFYSFCSYKCLEGWVICTKAGIIKST
jgi:hypothetical protein